MTKPSEIFQPAVLIAIGAVTILAMNRGRKRHERSRLETADEMRSRCAAEKAAQDMLSHARGVKGGQGKIVLRGPAIVTRGRTPLRLHYFPTRNRAEVARLLLEISHEPYEAVCYFYQTFLNCRSQFPFGELPVLELSDGTMIVQQHTIVRYIADIARMNGGRSRVKQAKVDMLFEQLIDMFESHTFSWDALKKNYFKESVTDVRDYRERVWKSCAIKYDIVMELGNKLPSSNPITKKNPKSSMMRVTCQDIKKVANHFGYPIPELVDRLTFLYDYDLDEALGRSPRDQGPQGGELSEQTARPPPQPHPGRVTRHGYSVMVLKTFEKLLRENNEKSKEWRWLDGSTKLSYADVYLFTKLYELSEVDQCGPDYGTTFQVPFLVKLQEKIEVLQRLGSSLRTGVLDVFFSVDRCRSALPQQRQVDAETQFTVLIYTEQA
ncbi:hypothetical protein FOZ60_011588 [Perkinsus olseni]|uniref:GST N-terminal domain-containing protein n=1 Tax=Perkinsus olseni TaxID=32597 RepID=A0A7J6NE61_PEROL|nr:hypothetical protein FOZ60_011588 [Perkinsus olseni]